MSTATLTRPKTSAPPTLGPASVKRLGVQFDGGPGQYGVTLTVEFDRASLDAAAGSTQAAEDYVASVLAPAAERFLETDPQARELAKLLATREEIAGRLETAKADASSAALQARAAVSSATFDALDDAGERQDAALRKVDRLTVLLDDVDSKIDKLRPVVSQGQSAAIHAAWQRIESEARSELTTLVAGWVSANPNRALVLAGVSGGAISHGHLMRHVTVRGE